MVQIFFIYADNCEHCDNALSIIERAVSKCKKTTCEILKFKYDSKAAIAIAVNKGIDDLPGIVIGDNVFVKECNEEEIVRAINEKAKKTT